MAGTKKTAVRNESLISFLIRFSNKFPYHGGTKANPVSAGHRNAIVVDSLSVSQMS
jgi:hypothetical protein